MINRLVWKVLSEDDTDENQSVFESELRARYPSLVDTSNYNYWKSLKTLLKDPSGNWAQNKIISRQENDARLQDSFKDEELPCISISTSTPFSAQDLSNSLFTGEICLFITSSISASDLNSWNIYKRVKRILFKDSINNQTFEADFSEFQIARLFINKIRIAEYSARSLKLYLQVKFQDI